MSAPESLAAETKEKALVFQRAALAAAHAFPAGRGSPVVNEIEKLSAAAVGDIFAAGDWDSKAYRIRHYRGARKLLLEASRLLAIEDEEPFGLAPAMSAKPCAACWSRWRTTPAWAVPAAP